MASRSIRLIASGLCILSWAVWDGYGQSPAKASAAMDGAARKALMAQYCASCHNEKLKTAGWWVEQVDPSHVEANPERWERIVHKLRAGMMPPPGKPRPEFATYETFL